ncbi:hypothetical protein [Pseudobacteroides cellulosolvens]|uniref:Prenyltransferase/squalene oxidase n=1 Tax=Pseudobacteroides cellulosolvens ATCC 35603 = DSM 2933 TaxID=398512 RepID=A0A0L6JV60_9FIRM|nr:hypothetical protein [Pseudobacteroides cellulosolvens]KNY29545.1 hypothetical protein Bccel_4819 [Pseudobacteroides cellulosolvens ATCC 35603 = DSM 2933]
MKAIEYEKLGLNIELVDRLLEQVTNWPGEVLKSHNDSSHLIHKLSFLADIGFDSSTPEIAKTVQKIIEHISTENLYQIKINIPKHFGGTGQEQWSWMLCDAPLVLYLLKRFGYSDNNKIKEGIEFLINLQKDNTWTCTVSSDLGKFRGPGRKNDPCPYATLLMLKLISLFEEYHDLPQTKNGAEALLTLWEQRKERRPYMFAMGSGFQKLKSPLIWYDILHVVDVLSKFKWLHKDRRLLDMVDIIKNKADDNGKYKAESVYRVWCNWEFGQKKIPSKFITDKIVNILKRIV